MTEHEHEEDPDDLGISPRTRLRHIEESLIRIDEKLDVRFDGLEKRVGLVETAQAGQASLSEFKVEATRLADEVSKTARDLAETKTATAVTLAAEATAKATTLAIEQETITTNVKAMRTRQDALDRKVAYYAGITLVFATAAGAIIGKVL